MMKIIFKFLLLGLFICPLFIYGNDNKQNKDQTENDQSKDTTKVSFFIDEKQVPFKYFFDQYQKDSVIFIGGESDPRMAIYYYGEKFRNGVFFYKKRK